MPRLLVEKGPDRGRFVSVIAGRQVVAGRDKAADLQLSDNMASRRHFMIASKGSIFGLKDLNSANGTLVNGRRAEGAQKLSFGDSIQVGETLLSWLSDEQAGSRGGMVGHVIGGYRIEERLGRGAMGTVYRATQLSLGRTVALKVLASELTKDAKFCEMFIKEARAAGSLNHPNIIQVYDVGDERNAYYFSMEFAAKGSVLDELQATKRIPLLRAVRIIRDACSALDYAERKGLVHRDIKPDNLMVMEGDTVKLGDLGLAMSTVELQAEQDGVFGTPHYIAPEQAMGKPIDHRADIYALGATFYRMLTGRTLYNGATVKEILKKQVREPHPPITEHYPDCPEAIRRIIDRMLAKVPAERYQHASEIAADLTDFENLNARRAVVTSAAFASRPAAIGPDRSQQLAATGTRRYLAIALLAALLAVASAAFVVWYFVIRGEGSQVADNGQPTAPEQPPANTATPSDPDDPQQRAIAAANQRVDRSIVLTEDLLTRAVPLGEIDERIAEIEQTLGQNKRASADRLKTLQELQDKLVEKRQALAQGYESALTEWQAAGTSANTMVEQFKIEGAKQVLADFIKRWEASPDEQVARLVTNAGVMMKNLPMRFQGRLDEFEQHIRREADQAEKQEVAVRPEAMAALARQVREAEQSCDSEEFKPRLAKFAGELETREKYLRDEAQRSARQALDAAFDRSSAALATALETVRSRIVRGEFRAAQQALQDWEVSDPDYLAHGSTERFAALRADVSVRRAQTLLEIEALRILGGTPPHTAAMPPILSQVELLKANEWPATVATVLGAPSAWISLRVDREINDELWTLESIVAGRPVHMKAAQFDTPQERRALAEALAHLFRLSPDMRQRLMDRTPSGPPAILGIYAWLCEYEAYTPAAAFIEHAWKNIPATHEHHALVREYYAWSLLGRAEEARLAGNTDAARSLITRLEAEFADTRANRGRK